MKMREFLTAFVVVYSIYPEIASQLVYPDSSLLQTNSHSPTPPTPRESTIPIRNLFDNLQRATEEHNDNAERAIASGISRLALSLNNFYLDQTRVNSVVLSPVSIANALALVLLGSNGKTFDELAAALGWTINLQSNSQHFHEQLGGQLYKLNRSSSFADELNVAAAIFVQNQFPIRDLYKQTSKLIYKNEIINLDFLTDNVHAQHVINAWISNKTNGKIASILSEPPPEETKVIIASALYFNGAWEKQFWEGFTRRRPFYQNGRKTQSKIEVEMMSNGGMFPYHKDTQLDCDIMGFPYKGNATTMYVVIPQDSDAEKLRAFEASLTAADILRLVENTEYTQSVVLFPKMKLEATSDLREPLQRLGVKTLFHPYEANLSLLSSGVKSKQQLKAKEVHEKESAAIDVSDRSDVLIFGRLGGPLKCTQIFNPNSNMSECEEIDLNTQKQVTYKKFGDKLGRRVTRESVNIDTLDKLREHLNRDAGKTNVENPSLYADQVIHKVYVDITEQGTEAAASTSVSLTRGGDITIFRADIPFLFFIWHEETKLILFWGSVFEPTPHFS